MEKLIYVMQGGPDEPSACLERLARHGVSAVHKEGGVHASVLLPDLTEEIRSQNPGRIGGAFDDLSAVFECWLPSLDQRAAIEEVLRADFGTLWGYLVTESTVIPCPHSPEEGERVPGITQWGIHDKPAAVSQEDAYHEWQIVHSKLSFDLHPARQSYDRNAIARRLTPESPVFMGIVLERFPSLDDFCDNARYFGDSAVVKEMIEHAPTFYDFESAITGGMSEFRFG